MDENKDKRYVKEIIKEYNASLNSWGTSDSWDLNQFRTLESMIFESTKIDVNANTLKRFFQQKTGNPQLATKDALCRFLGYSSYTDFVMKKTKKEKEEIASFIPVEALPENTEIEETKVDKPQPQPEPQLQTKPKTNEAPEPIRRRNKPYTLLVTILLIGICGYLFYAYKLKDIYIEYLISRVEFTASKVKGTCPLTVTFSYKIPSSLFDDISIVCEEANGDILENKLHKETDKVNATYIYEGEAFSYLKYKGETIRSIKVEGRKTGWSVFIREERKKVFKVIPIEQAFHKGGYASLSFEDIPEEARTNHLFTSYVFYKDKLVDGDNFVYEARVRNSSLEHAIPCSDIMMYIYSDTAMHGFAMNENGYAYIKFMSGEKTIKGDEYNLSRFNFNSSEWHIMSIKVVNKKTNFYVDGKEVLDMNYAESLGYANELVLRFKGCGAVDYVKVYELNGKLVYEENFTDQPSISFK